MQVVSHRAQFYYDLPARPFYGITPTQCKILSGRDLDLVAGGHDGRCEGPV